jgi:hypothetical protein
MAFIAAADGYEALAVDLDGTVLATPGIRSAAG